MGAAVWQIKEAGKIDLRGCDVKTKPLIKT